MKWIVKKILYIFLLIACLLSCHNRDKEQARKILNEWIDKEIFFPESLKFSIQGIVESDFSICDSKYKILVYADSMGCTSCKLHLSEWGKYISYMDSIHHDNIQFLFFFFPKNRRDIYVTLRTENFKYPICIDTLDILNKSNSFPSNMKFQTFLLNKNNKVLAIGNPIMNPHIKELFMKIMSGKSVFSSLDNQPLTKISLSLSRVDLGCFPWEKEQKVGFEISNMGEAPLVINDVITSCGCVAVEYSKEPVQPGRKLNLKIKYQAEHPEHFNKTITVYCNAKGSPFHLTIGGNAK